MIKRRGFTLVELAVSLVIIALILGSILVPLSTQVAQRQISDTEKILSQVQDALIGYAMVNGRLPRPAQTFSNGIESGTTCASELACTGFIPWTTIGSPKLDAWGNIIQYSVTPAFANATFTLSSVGTKTVQQRDPTSHALVSYATTVPVVVFSFGPQNFGTSDSGTTRSSNSSGGTNVDEITNKTALTVSALTFIRGSLSTQTDLAQNPGGEFDDIVTFIPTTVLFSRLVAAGKLP